MPHVTVFDPAYGDRNLSSALINEIAQGGKLLYVDETLGDDDYDGSSESPFATISAALAAATANHGDSVVLKGTVHVSSTLTWNKAGVNLIGQRGPSNNCRSRISQTGSTAFTPLVSVTAQGCQFINIGSFHGFDADEAEVAWSDSGGRNYYYGCQFLGGGHATSAANAGCRSLVVDGGNGENLFERCTLGLDTVVRATGNNATLELTNASPRNIFRNCLFQANVSNAPDVHVYIGQGGIDRYVLFDDCIFHNAQYGGPGATGMTACFSVHASAGGVAIVRNPLSVGAGKISAAGPVYVVGVVPTAGTSGLAVAAS